MNPESTTISRAVLTFSNELGSKGSFSIPRARFDKQSHEAVETMQLMLSSGALELSSIGTPVQIKGAKLIHTVRTPLLLN